MGDGGWHLLILMATLKLLSWLAAGWLTQGTPWRTPALAAVMGSQQGLGAAGTHGNPHSPGASRVTRLVSPIQPLSLRTITVLP